MLNWEERLFKIRSMSDSDEEKVLLEDEVLRVKAALSRNGND